MPNASPDTLKLQLHRGTTTTFLSKTQATCWQDTRQPDIHKSRPHRAASFIYGPFHSPFLFQGLKFTGPDGPSQWSFVPKFYSKLVVIS